MTNKYAEGYPAQSAIPAVVGSLILPDQLLLTAAQALFGADYANVPAPIAGVAGNSAVSKRCETHAERSKLI